MRKKVYVLIVTVLFVVGLLSYLDWYERNSSYSSPDEALNHVKNPPFEVVEVIDTKILEDQNYGYVFFYSNVGEGDHYIVSEFEKGKYGWRYVGMFGGGRITEDNANGRLMVGESENGPYHGLATANVSAVTLGHLKAELISLEDKDMKMWIFFNLTSEDMDNELVFLDEEGKVLE
jgi:hypothetical protein